MAFPFHSAKQLIPKAARREAEAIIARQVFSFGSIDFRADIGNQSKASLSVWQHRGGIIDRLIATALKMGDANVIARRMNGGASPSFISVFFGASKIEPAGSDGDTLVPYQAFVRVHPLMSTTMCDTLLAELFIKPPLEAPSMKQRSWLVRHHIYDAAKLLDVYLAFDTHGDRGLVEPFTEEQRQAEHGRWTKHIVRAGDSKSEPFPLLELCQPYRPAAVDAVDDDDRTLLRDLQAQTRIAQPLRLTIAPVVAGPDIAVIAEG
jgi:hypothetical protein